MRRELHGVREPRAPRAGARLLRAEGRARRRRDVPLALGVGVQRDDPQRPRARAEPGRVSAGQEFVTTVADYLRYALGLESTRAVGLFIETVRDPDGFRSALGARERTRHPRRGAEGRSRGTTRASSWRRTRARSPARTAPTRRCSTRTGSRGSRASTRWRTRSRCSPQAGEPDRGRWRACTTREGSGRCSSTRRRRSACRSPRSRARPRSGWRRCSTPACRP